MGKAPIRIARAWVTRGAAALLLAALAACGGGGGGEAPPPLPAFLQGVAPYSQAASAPAGFEVITLAEAERLASTGTFRWLTEAERTRSLAEATARDEEDRRRIDTLAAADPELARRLVDPTPGPRVEALADGNWRVTLRPGDPGSPAFITQGRRFAIQDLATGWREGASRSNREGLFRTLIAALPEDQREGLPNSDSLAGVADSVLDAAITTVTDRVNTRLDSEGLPANPEPLSESFPSPISGLTGILPSGCLNYGPAGLYARNSWPLKTSLTPVRDQGGRGTCTSFGIAGAMETLIKHNYGRSADLSEQLLFGTAKGEWFFEGQRYGELFFGDGLPLVQTIDRMQATGFSLYAEAGWRYNRSTSRENDPTDAPRVVEQTPYINSCLDYSGTCTDTNHQQRATCVEVPTGYGGNSQWHCAFWNQLDSKAQDSERYSVLGKTNLWVALPGMTTDQVASVALTSARAHLAAGKPVVFGMEIDEAFAAAGTADYLIGTPRRIDPGARLTSRSFAGDKLGAHAMAMVGFVSFAAIDAAAEAAGIPAAQRLTYQLDSATEGGGFFIIKNSWGCGWGDGGYTYATPAYLKPRIHSLVALNTVTGAAPSVSLAVNRSSVSSTSQEILLVGSGNPLVRKVEFYRVEGLTTSKLGEDLEAPYRRLFTLPAGTQGVQRYFAVASDSAGNRASSNVVTVSADIPGVLPPQDLVRPRVALVSSATTVLAPATVQLTASTTRGTHPIQRVEFYVGPTKFGEDTAAPYVMSFPLTFYNAPGAVFSARAFDTEGNFSGMATEGVAVDLPPAPNVASFGASPSTTPPGGGPVTLNWNVSGANLLTLDNGIGSVASQSSLVVRPRRTTTYTLTATNSGGPTTATVTVTVPPPAITTFTATPTNLPTGGGAATLSWAVVGATSVQISGLGRVAAAGSASVNPLTTTTYTLSASALSGTRSSAVTVIVGADTVAPTVSLTSSSLAVVAPGSVTLTATASDNVGIAAVDFYRGSLRIGSDTTPGDGFTLNVDFGTGDVGSRSFTAHARDPSNNVGTSAAVEIVISPPADTTAPTVSLLAAPTAVVAPGATTLTATASDNVGVVAVDFLRSGTVIATDTTPGNGFTHSVSLDSADVGNVSFTTVARDAAGNVTTSASASVSVSLPADTTSPTVSLAASPTAVTAPGTTTLTATASDNVGVVAVEFLRGNTVMATDTTPGNGFTHSVSLGSADVGNVSFTAVARDAAGNSTTSLAAIVVVSLPVSTTDRWVSPTGSDSNPGTQALPYQSVGRAMAAVGANGTVWLAAGTYPWATENGRNGYDQQSFKVMRIPAGVTLSAQTAGTVTINFGLEAQGAATVSGLRFSSAANDAGDHAPTAISTPFEGLVQLRGVSFGRVGTLIYTRGGDLTFDAQGVVGHPWLDSEFQGSFGRVDQGHVRILGGVMSPQRLPDTTNVNARGFGSYGYSGRLTFDGVTLNIPTAPAGVGQAVFIPIQGGQFAFLNGQAVQAGTPPYSVLVQSDSSSSARISNSTVSGRFTHVVAIFAGATVRVEDSTLYGGVYAIGPTGGEEPAGSPLPSISVTNSTIRNFVIGIAMPNGGALTITDSIVRDNTAIGVSLTAEPLLPYRSAVYTLRVRNSGFSGNGTGTLGHAGISMVGAATSVFDFGTAASPGNNTLTGGDPATMGPALRVAVPTALTVTAVGNTWGLTQGSDVSGRYNGNVVVSAGASGSNYVVTQGALRLAGTP